MSRPVRPQDPLYAGPRQGQRGSNETRVSSPNVVAPLRPSGRPAEGLENAQSRAARFEDEKRRIIDSLFSKREEDGIQAESYITHVRISEDAAYPSTPPPPDADPSNKKNRIIMVSVRRSGRVKVHKGRENPNGTFSIGKTWNLDDLSSIQSYTSLIPRSNQEQLEKQWAHGVGFIVTLGKAYYWQAPTAKEKDFFIASLVKIFRKYTGGKMPELYGFAGQEIEKLTGLVPVQSSSASQSISSLDKPPSIPAATERRPQSPFSSKSQTSEPSREPVTRLRSYSRNEATPPARETQRAQMPSEPLRSPARKQSRDDEKMKVNNGVLQSAAALLPVEPQNVTAATSSYPSAQSSQTSLSLRERPSGAFTNGLPAKPKMPPTTELSRDTPSIQSASSRPSTAVSERKPSFSRFEKEIRPDLPTPERRRPFASKADSRPGSRSGPVSETASQFATPAASPSDLQDELPAIATVSNNVQRRSPSPAKKDDYFNQKEVPKATEPTTSPEASKDEIVSPASTVASEDLASPTADGSNKAEFRPGLGPMIKKKSTKDIAGQFRRAALAAAAFQPRQGGGAARFKAMQEKEKGSSEPDGITGVVPAPLLRGQSSEKSVPSTPTFPPSAEKLSLTTPPATIPAVQILRSTTQDSVTSVESVKTPPESEKLRTQPEPEKPKAASQEQVQTQTAEVRPSSPDKARSRSPQRRKRQRQQAEISKYCQALGVDAQVLEGRGAEFNDLLTEFGWEGMLVEYSKIDDFEAEIRREIGRAQATGWLGHVEQQEGKVQELAKAFDKAIEECEELDGLFTLYSHELETLSGDIEYIEAQSQGLQVQTANQKLLQTELQNLLQTLTIPSHELSDLKKGQLDTVNGVERIERSLALLYNALIMIDPDIRQNKIRLANGGAPDRSGVGVYADTEIGQMRAVREKKDEYRIISSAFTKRLNDHLPDVFSRIEQRSTDDARSSSMSSATSLDTRRFEKLRQELWMYNAMMLFVREFSSHEWQYLIARYELNVKQSYQDQFLNFAMSQRRTVYKPNGEELDALFTTQEKEKMEEGLASSAARKLTVRRVKNPRPSAMKQELGTNRDGKPAGWEVFDTVLQQYSRIVAEEQNFMVHFFHLGSQASADFTEIVTSRPLTERRTPNFNARQPYEPDRALAKIIVESMAGVYTFWPIELQKLLDWTLNLDQLQGVGVLYALEQCLATYDETNQEFITKTLRNLHDKLSGLFNKFVDEQIKAIEETKVKVKKRKGVISFMRVFPLFSTVVEQMIPSERSIDDTLEVRSIVNDAYNKILKAMWESLTFIAKDNPVAGSSGASAVAHPGAPQTGDPEDKEALNYHILLIENMSHFIEEVGSPDNDVLASWADRANQDMHTHLTQYVDAVIRRPIGKWLDFLESTEAMMRNTDAANASGIANKPSHSRSAAKKVLSAHDGKEVKKGIDTLKKRIEKHFGDIDDTANVAGSATSISTISTSTVGSLSKRIIAAVMEECAIRYAGAWDRMKLVIDQVYDGNLEIDWKRDDVVATFRAKS